MPQPTPQLDAIVRPVMAKLKSAAIPAAPLAHEPPPRPCPFVTISRQCGAGSTQLALHLAQQLNAAADASGDNDSIWRTWDRELVEKVASHYHFSEGIVAEFAERSRSWLDDLLLGLQTGGGARDADELRIFHRVGATIRALAQAGHAIIVGRGGWFLTRDMPAGVHVRLVAPLPWRIAARARTLNCTSHEAAASIARTDHARESFYARYGPPGGPKPEYFTVTLNAASASPDTLARCIAGLVGNTLNESSGGSMRNHVAATSPPRGGCP
jgi:hypothetical protein